MLRDLSNTGGAAAQQQQQQQKPVLKTFERRPRSSSSKRQDDGDAPAAPAENAADADSPGASSRCADDSPASASTAADDWGASATQQRRRGCNTNMSAGLSRCSRRSSVLRAAALPGHRLFSGSVQASRSLLLSKLSKARRKAYLAYTQQMAAYFAEVDQFELLEESPGAEERLPRSRLHSIRETAAVPAAAAAEQDEEEQLEQEEQEDALAASPAVARHPAAAESSSPAAAAASVSRLSAAADVEQPGGLASPPAPSPVESSDLSAATPLPSGSAQQQGRRSLAAETPAALPSREEESAISSSAGGGRSSLAASTPEPELLQEAGSGSAQAGAAAAGVAASARLSEQLQALSLQQAVSQEQLQQEQLASLLALQATTPGPLQRRPDDTAPSDQAAAQQRQPRAKGAHSKQQAAAAADDEEAAEAALQQAEQQRLAEKHFEAWVAEQASAAAAEQLQQLELAASEVQQLTPLQQMLQACGQPVGVAAIPCMKDFLVDLADLRDVVKLGEGTYGEAFKSGQVVFKFVPMEGDNLVNGWPQKHAGDLLGEAIIALALSGLRQQHDDAGNAHDSHSDAFVHTHRVGVCRGPYPPAFVKAWRAWDKAHTSENDFIGGLPPGQLYAVFAMANCGRDLEGYQLSGFDQARSMLLQVALALAVAEEALAFEHRDLHWGNVMLSPADGCTIDARLRGCTIRLRAEGAKVRLIDFTASRLTTPGGDVVFCDLEGEDGLFDGPKGKPQFETYRRMRKLTRKDWAGSHPGTNVLWLLYLVELLLSADKPITGASGAQKRALREFKKRLSSAAYSNCSEVVWDELFEGLWSAVDASS